MNNAENSAHGHAVALGQGFIVVTVEVREDGGIDQGLLFGGQFQI